MHHVLQLLRKAWIVAQLERLHTVRLQTVRPPDPPHRCHPSFACALHVRRITRLGRIAKRVRGNPAVSGVGCPSSFMVKQSDNRQYRTGQTATEWSIEGLSSD